MSFCPERLEHVRHRVPRVARLRRAQHVDEDLPVREVAPHPPRHLARQLRLPDPADPLHRRDRRRAFRQRRLHRRDLVLVALEVADGLRDGEGRRLRDRQAFERSPDAIELLSVQRLLLQQETKRPRRTTVQQLGS